MGDFMVNESMEDLCHGRHGGAVAESLFELGLLEGVRKSAPGTDSSLPLVTLMGSAGIAGVMADGARRRDSVQVPERRLELGRQARAVTDPRTYLEEAMRRRIFAPGGGEDSSEDSSTSIERRQARMDSFIRLLDSWEERAKQEGLGRSELDRGYLSMIRVLEGSGTARQSAAQSLNRMELVENLARNAARLDARPLSLSDNLEIQRQTLDEIARDKLSDSQLAQFRRDVAAFTERAGKQSLGDAEVARTFAEVSRLLAAVGDSPVSQADRARIALEAMHLAACPTDVRQSRYKTCNVSSVEVRTYSLYPSKAARVVVDVATTGSYTAENGSRATMRPEDISGCLDDKRGHASQIFQTTAVNLHWQNQTRVPDGLSPRAQDNNQARSNDRTKGEIRYELHQSGQGRDAGERLMDYSVSPPAPLMYKDIPVCHPALSDGEIAAVQETISGRREKSYVRSDVATGSKHPGIVEVRSEQELHDLLRQASRGEGGLRLPITLRMHVGHPPFNRGRGAIRSPDGSFAGRTPFPGGGAAPQDVPTDRVPSDETPPAPGFGLGPSEGIPLDRRPVDDGPDPPLDPTERPVVPPRPPVVPPQPPVDPRPPEVPPYVDDEDWHVVTVMDYDPSTRRVAVDNSWAPEEDYLTPARRLPLAVLYRAMFAPAAGRR